MHHMQLDLSFLPGLQHEDHSYESSEKTTGCLNSKKVTTLQSKHKGHKEVDIALEIPKVGVFSVETMRTMRNYHRAIDPIAAIDKATVWVATIDFSINIDPWYPVKEDESLLNGLKTTRLQSNEVRVYLISIL
ncbi:hypothetical protein JG688_00017217 [Phytophthora aleatoria]|uniref:Uncharacterized protein n=1 Tax=Phytophthora aleatoria TaxID=2496075 RepID=A0A8J5ICU5_9STRA|nr:hypothetical protein JG688_00017217 [Phytophthora aleatoria]